VLIWAPSGDAAFSGLAENLPVGIALLIAVPVPGDQTLVNTFTYEKWSVKRISGN
jgi:hypothetical protein